MVVDIFSWPNLNERTFCRTWGSNPQPSAYLVHTNSMSNVPTRSVSLYVLVLLGYLLFWFPNRLNATQLSSKFRNAVWSVDHDIGWRTHFYIGQQTIALMQRIPRYFIKTNPVKQEKTLFCSILMLRNWIYIYIYFFFFFFFFVTETSTHSPVPELEVLMEVNLSVSRNAICRKFSTHGPRLVHVQITLMLFEYAKYK